jgi:hypothetical protein
MNRLLSNIKQSPFFSLSLIFDILISLVSKRIEKQFSFVCRIKLHNTYLFYFRSKNKLVHKMTIKKNEKIQALSVRD